MSDCMEYELWQWAFFALAALIVGAAKSSVPGIGMLNVLIFQNILLAKDATGFGLPLLIVGDVCALVAYRQHADWGKLLRLFPWMAIGVVGGYFALGRIDDRQARLLVAVVLLSLLGFHLFRRYRPEVYDPNRRRGPLLGPASGFLAGFISLVANAAGPVMALYLLAMRMPKMAFMGTSVMFFFVMNLFKVPFLMDLGLVNKASLAANLALVPFVMAGSYLGYRFARNLKQKWFDGLAFWLTALSVVHMVWISL